MTDQEKADKELQVFQWMKNRGYDRRASKDIAPIIVEYLNDQFKPCGEDHNTCNCTKVSQCGYKN